MTRHATDFVGRDAVARTARMEAFVAATAFDRPTLVMDRAIVASNYRALAAGLGRARIHYALKANPAPEILATLAGLGSGFDAASRAEIELCLAAGAAPGDISYGNTIKRDRDIAFAHATGITLFAADAEEELHKIAQHAPGSEIYLRLVVEPTGADWPLTRKFGCGRDRALPLLHLARELGLRPRGLSFHVGSQTREAAMWAGTLDQVAAIWRAAQADGIALDLLNLGGGFPAAYDGAVAHPTRYAAEVMELVTERFGEVPRLMAEPGRAMVADAGQIAAEVLLVSRKSETDLHRWVYLDIGRFSGLAETEGEMIRYPIATARDGAETGPCILAGPSCDSVDVLYERRPVALPVSLRAGDRVVIRDCGAYTSTYASVGFNGFPPLDVVVL